MIPQSRHGRQGFHWFIDVELFLSPAMAIPWPVTRNLLLEGFREGVTRVAWQVYIW